MEKPKSLKETMAEIKTQFKEDQKRTNDKFKTDREQNKIKAAEQKETARLKQQQQQQVQSAPVVVNTPIENPTRRPKAVKKRKPKPRRKSSLDTSGGKDDVLNVFLMWLLAVVMTVPLFLFVLLIFVFVIYYTWTSIF